MFQIDTAWYVLGARAVFQITRLRVLTTMSRLRRGERHVGPETVNTTHRCITLCCASLLGCTRSVARPRPGRFLSWDNVDEEVKLVGLAEGLRNVCPRERAPLVRVGNDECTRGNLRNEDLQEGGVNEGS